MTEMSPAHTPNTGSISLNNTASPSQAVQHTDAEQGTAPPHIRQPTIQSQPGDMKFGNELWDQFDLVYNRVTKGRHDMKFFQSYIDSRAAAERTYAKALLKSVDPAVHDLEASSADFATCYGDVREAALSTAKTHDDTATLCTQISAQLKDIINDLKSNKTRLMNAYQQLVKDKTTKRQVHDKARDTYVQAVKSAEDAVALRDQSRGKVAEKKYVKLDEAVRDCIRKVEEATHPHYRKSVDALVDSQRNHDATIVILLNEFEEIEKKRLQSFQAVMTNFANIYSTQENLFKTIYATTSQHLSQIDIRTDIQSFIQQYKTGKQHEAYVQYIPQRSTIIGHQVDASAPSPMNSVTNGLANTYINTPVNNANAIPIQPSAPITPAAGAQQQQFNTTAPIAAAAMSSPAVVGGATVQALALYDFAPSEPDELPFKQGDVIQLVKYSDAEDWWQGQIHDRVGLFPKNYVAKQNASTKQYIDASGVVHQPGVAGTASAVTAVADPVQDNGAAAGAAAGGDVEQPKLMNASCTSLYDFDGQDADELTFKAGQKLIITGELNGWYLGRLDSDSRVGIFPSNYVSLDK